MVKTSDCAVFRLTTFKFARLLDRQLGRQRSLDDLVYIGGGAPEKIGEARAVGEQTAGEREFHLRMDPRELVVDCKRDNALTLAEQQSVGERDDAVGLPLNHGSECARRIVRGSHFEGARAYAQSFADRLGVSVS